MVIVIRIDLDKYDMDELDRLVVDGIVSISEASEAMCFKALGEYDQVLKVREWQKARAA